MRNMEVTKNLYWFFRQLLKSGYYISYKKLYKNQFLSLEEIVALNWEKRKKIVRYAYENVPYYKKKYDRSNFHPDQLVYQEDFLKIPILTRDEIKRNFDALVSQKAIRNNLFISGTGGTTGEPLMVYKQKKDKGLANAMQARMLKWWGIPLTSNYAIATRTASINRIKEIKVSSGLIGHVKSILKQLVSNSKKYLPKHVSLDAALISADKMDVFIREMININSKYLVGYTGAIDELAKYFSENYADVDLKLKAVWTTASPLTAVQRNNIENAFNCRVYDQYGSIEVYWLGAECAKQNGLHFFYDVRHIEFLNHVGIPTAPEITGDVIITDLENYDFPIIRYKNGDRGSWKKETCTCGVNLPLMNNILGRSSDKILLKDGSLISGEFLTTIFDCYAEVVNGFQIIQKSKEKIIINVVMDDDKLFKEISDQVGKKLYSITKGLVNIEILKSKRIKHYKGKSRFVISELRKDGL
jgi:phenylacetate-CoA ligase